MNKIAACLICILLLISAASCLGEKNINMSEVKADFSEYIDEKMADGTIAEITDYWFENYDNAKTFDFDAMSAENGTIRFGTKAIKPMSYIFNNNWTGLTIEIIYNYCVDRGYGLIIDDYGSTNSIVLAAASGKIDIGGSAISITEQRKQSVDFSSAYFNNAYDLITTTEHAEEAEDLSYFNGKIFGINTGTIYGDFIKTIFKDTTIREYNDVTDAILALNAGKVDAVVEDDSFVRVILNSYSGIVKYAELASDDKFGYVFAKDVDTDEGFIESIKSSFTRTFIDESRWMMFLDGIDTTLFITVASVIIGLSAGLAIYLTCRHGNRLANGITRFIMWIIDGLPAVVFLMILYYVVFGSLSISSTAVSVICFSLIFTSSTLSMLKNSVSAIDKSQYEVSAALGYSENQAFFKMILPQALRYFWMPFKGAIKAQIKATAIVGYISTQDLTKVVDIVRSSTYEAFFPLIATAVIYFILAWILIQAVNLIQLNTAPSPKKSRKFLKGVQTHD